MSFSSSKPQNTTSTTTSLTTKNLNLSGNSGVTVAGGESGSSQNLNISTTDLGAVQAGTALSQHALDQIAAISNSSGANVANLASKSITATGSAYGAALTAVQDNTSDTVSVIQQLATQFGTALSNLTGSEQTQLGNVVSALNSTYTANNTSANQQVINATTAASDSLISAVKYIAIAAVAAAALYFYTRK